MQWKIVRDEPYWLEVEEDVETRDEQPSWRVYIKWDGCAEVTNVWEGPIGQTNTDQIHICQIGKFVDALLVLREMARQRGFEVD